MTAVRTILATFLCGLAAAGLSAGEPSSDAVGTQPQARFRVSIPRTGGKAEVVRDPATVSAAAGSSYTVYTPTATGESSIEIITPQAEDKRETEPLVLAVLYGRDITDADVVRELVERRGRETLEWLIGRDILRHELERLKVDVLDSEVDERLEVHLEGFRKAFPNLSRPDDLTRAASGMLLEEYRERSVWAELALRKIMRVALKPSTTQLRALYAERQFDFIRPERIRISQVFIAPQADPKGEGIANPDDWETARKQILEAHARLRTGEDFMRVARAYGTGGQLSRWVRRGELLRELEEAAFAISPGSSTAPLKSSMGFHIIHLEEREERVVPPFEEVKEEVLAQFEEMQFVLRAGEFMARLRERALRNGGLVVADSPDFFSGDGREADGQEM